VVLELATVVKVGLYVSLGTLWQNGPDDPCFFMMNADDGFDKPGQS
jgi:hypothetical protein